MSEKLQKLQNSLKKLSGQTYHLARKQKNYLTIICSITLLILAFFLRSKIFIAGDFLFLPDQARDLLLVKEMVENGKLPLIGARGMSGGYVFHGPMWIWLLGIPFLIFQGNPIYIYPTVS